MSIEQEIRDQIENNKKLKQEVGYINNHLSILEGFCREDKQNQVDDAYKRGLEDGKASIDKGCEGCKWESKKGYDEPCKHCCNAYRNQYAPMPKDEICFGDEIVVNGERGVVVSHENEENATIWALLSGYRTPQVVNKNNYTKTGRSFDMAGIMEAVKNG